MVALCVLVVYTVETLFCKEIVRYVRINLDEGRWHYALVVRIGFRVCEKFGDRVIVYIVRFLFILGLEVIFR